MTRDLFVTDRPAMPPSPAQQGAGMERFYWNLGFMSLLTAMARFQDRSAGIARGHLGAYDERWDRA